MTTKQFNEMLAKMAEGWIDRDYDSVVGHFSENVFYSDSHNYTLHNSADLLEFFREDDYMPQHCKFHNAVFDEAQQIGTAEYTYEGTFRYHGTVWIDLNRDKIVSWREYQHRSEKDWNEFWKR